MKTVKKEILNVISLWVSRTTDVELGKTYSTNEISKT